MRKSVKQNVSEKWFQTNFIEVITVDPLLWNKRLKRNMVSVYNTKYSKNGVIHGPAAENPK